MADYSISGPIPTLEEVGVRLNGPISNGPPDILPGLLPRQGQLVIAGQTNVGKSLISLEVISSLTTGDTLWGQLVPTMQARKVLYILGEHYVEVIQRMLLKTQLTIPDNVYIIGPEQLKYDKWLVTQGRPNLVAIQKFCKWAEGVDLIVFDPFSSFVCGVDVENDNVTMRLVLDTMSLIAQSTGASCLVLAHQGKPMMDKFGDEQTRKTYAIRGASGIEDAATNIFYMNKTEGTGSTPMTFELICRKYKGDGRDFRLLRNSETLTHHIVASQQEAVSELKTIDTRAEIARLQAHNPDFSYRTSTRIIAAVHGVAEETVKRWLKEKV